MRLSWQCAFVGILALADCTADPNGPDPLLTLHATVIASELPLRGQLVPALTFTPMATNWGRTEFFVSGEHEGSLLSNFSLRIYDEPPEEALVTLTKGEPAMALGGITAVSPDHPDRLEWTRDDSGTLRVCAPDGECGEPRSNPCGTFAAPSCLGTLVPGKNWGNHGVSGSFVILYLSEPASAGSIYSVFFAQGKPLPAGYNLIRYVSVWETLDTQARSEYFECHARALRSALNQFNEDHGTSFTDHTMISNDGQQRDAQLLVDWDGAMIASTVSEGCVLPGAQQLAPQSAADSPLKLVFVDWRDG